MEKKIRVYSEKENKMYYKGMLTFDLSDNSWLFEASRTSFHSHFGKVMLSSGFYSKNKKEIFQGDILKCQDALCIIGNDFTFESKTCWWLDEWNFEDDSIRFEVIGNIHENKTLYDETVISL